MSMNATDVRSSKSCPRCGATLNICNHFEWCPEHRMNRPSSLYRDAVMRVRWSFNACHATADPVISLRDGTGRVVAELDFATFKAEFAMALRKEADES